MKILHINTLDKKGGASMIMNNLNSFLNESGESSLMAVGQKKRKGNSSFSFSNHIRLSNLSIKITGKDLPYALKNKLRKKFLNETSYINNKKLFKSKAFIEADIVHFHNIHGSYLNLDSFKEICRIKPVVWTLHDAWSILEHEIHSPKNSNSKQCDVCSELLSYDKIFKKLKLKDLNKKKEIFKNSDVNIVTPSKWLFNIVDNSLLNNNKLSLINNGINVNKFKPAIEHGDYKELRKELGLPEDKKIILFLADGGKNNIFKGWYYVEKLINEYKEDNSILFLCIGGKGKDEENVKYLKYIFSLEELSKYYSVVDFFLYPTLADNLPLVVLEAMSCSLPVLTFKTGGVPEIVEHRETGYLAEYKNYEDFKRGFKWFLDLDREQYKKMKMECRKNIVENFSLEKMNNKYYDLYKNILDKNNYESKN